MNSRWVCLWVFLVALPVAAQNSLDPPYLNEMPSIERVLEDVKGKDRLDTMARQSAAMQQLKRVIEDMAGQRRWQGLTPDETRLRDAYAGEGFRIKDEAIAGLRSTSTGRNSPRLDWLDAQFDYENDPKVRAELLRRYFSPEFLNALGVQISNTDARVAASQAQIRSDLGIEPDFFEGLDASAVAAGIIMLMPVFGLIALCVFRETRTFGISWSDPSQLRAGFKRRSLTWASGTVANYNGGWVYSSSSSEVFNQTTRQWETKTSTSSTYVERFDLVNGDAKEPIYVENSWIEIPDGQVATAVRTVPKGGKEEADWVVFYNRTSGGARPATGPLAHLFRARLFVLWPWCFLVVLVVSVIQPFTFLYGAAGIMHGLLVLIPVWAFSWWVLTTFGKRRVKRFVRRDAERLLTAIKASE